MQVFDSNEKIGIYYFYPDGVPAGTGALHAGVFYSKVELGVRVTRTFDAGPTNKNVSGIDGALEVAKELAGIRDPATPYGKMTMTPGRFDGTDSRDLRLPDDIVGANILKSGDDLSQSYGEIKTVFDQAGSGLYYYFPYLLNSNTVARAALSAGSITWTPAYPDSAILFIPTEGGTGTGGGRPTIMQPFGPQSGSGGIELYFPGSQFGLSTDVTPTPDFINGVPFERDGYIYTYTHFLGQLTIKAEPTAATMALRGELATYIASVNEINKLIEETWVKSNSDTVDRKYQYSGDNQSPTDMTTTFSRNGVPERQEDVSANGTSAKTVFDTGTEPWSSQTSAFDVYQRLQSQRVVLDGGGQQTKQYDPNNTHPYTEVEVDEDATGKITAAKPKLDGQPNPDTAADFSAVGQVLGSALGRALAPNNQFVQLVAGTVVGAVGQRLAQAFVASLATDASKFDPASVFANFNVSIAGAGASSIASFLVAELGTALHFEGFSGHLFNAAAGGFAGSVASQIATKMAGTAGVAGVSFDAAIAGIQWTSAASSAAYGVSSLFGTFLANELEPAQTHQGAVGGQLLGAVGSAVGITAALSGALGTVLGFIAPGIGSLIGTILGTLIGDAFGNVPHPAAVDLLDQAGTLYAATHYQVSATDGGDYSTPDQLAVPALAIINAYLGAVKGAAFDHSKQVTLGYQANPVFYIDGVPGHPAIGTYLYPNAAVQAAALDVLQNTEVIGGDLLMKRAHQAFTHGSHSNRNHGTNARRHFRAGGWRPAKRATASMACIHKRFA
jgi:hypothetical protein